MATLLSSEAIIPEDNANARSRCKDITPSMVNGVPIDYYGYMALAYFETGVPIAVQRDLVALAENMPWNQNEISEIRSDGSVDLGLGQHNSRFVEYFANKYNNGKLYNPLVAGDSIMITARILAHNMDTFKDPALAVTAYHQGRAWAFRNGIDYGYAARAMSNAESADDWSSWGRPMAKCDGPERIGTPISIKLLAAGL